jgi:ABC-2 type transport system permease protein
VFEGMRAIIMGRTFPASHLLWATGLAALYILLATTFFVRTYRYAVRTGLLARYSAESVS